MLKDLYVLRLQLGLSQKELANKSKITKNMIHRMENGEHIPRLNTIVKASRAVGMTIGETAEFLAKGEDY